MIDSSEDYKRKFSIRLYIGYLPSRLYIMHDKADSYPPQKILETKEHYSLNCTYAHYALAMFATKEAFEEYYNHLGESYDYDAIRNELAELHFDGNVNFDKYDIFSIADSLGIKVHIGLEAGSDIIDIFF